MHENDFIKDYRMRGSTLVEKIGWRERSNVPWAATMDSHGVLQYSIKLCGKVPSVKPGARVGNSWFGERAESLRSCRAGKIGNTCRGEHLIVELAGIHDSGLCFSAADHATPDN